MASTQGAPTWAVTEVLLSAALGEPFEVPRPQLHRELAHVLENEGMEAAVDPYHELMDADPDGWDFGFESIDRLRRLLAAKERFPEAAEVAELNADVDHYLPDAQYARGVARLAAGEPDAARRSFERAIEIDPEHAGARGALGSLDG